MGQTTAIEWCHHTLNIFRGCAKVHAGCTNCYAEKNVGVKMNGITWGEVWQGGQRVVMAESGWKHPLKWARDAARAGERRRVFCSSLADVLEVPERPERWPATWTEAQVHVRAQAVRLARAQMDAARERLWDTIRRTTCAANADGMVPFPGPRQSDIKRFPGLDWLLLTKRPENWALVPPGVRELVWLGTSVSDQQTADEWGERLRRAEGFRLKFYSVEPLVGRIERLPLDGISWVVVGGESGPKARPCAVPWVRSIVEQCREAGVPCFVKQLGARVRAEGPDDIEGEVFRTIDASEDGFPGYPRVYQLPDAKGGDMANWPEDIRVRELPTAA